MAETRSTYDESNEVWPYFVITLLSVVLIPVTLAQLAQLAGGSARGATLRPAHTRFRASRQRRTALASARFWLTAAGWVAFAMLVYFVRSVGSSADADSVAVWDPYALLGVSTSATVREIRSAYRQLSLQFHPDKVKDLADATKEAIDAKYVEISKAYRALTDEDTRENFLLYGHPDGPQQVTHGIALPAFLFDPAGSLAFVSLYLFGFGVGVPLVVSKWWAASQRRTRRGLLQETAAQFCQLLAKEQAHFITNERVLREVLTSADMDEALGGSLRDFDARLAALRAYLERATPQGSSELTVATETARLLMGLHDFAAEFKSFALCQRLLQLHRSVVQAVPFEVTLEGEYAQLDGADLNAVLEKKPNQTQILDVVQHARSYFPKLHLLRAEFRVSGEDAVTPNSRVFLQFKFVVLPLGERVPQISEQEVAAIGGGGGSGDASELLEPAAQNKKQPALPTAVAPHYPLDVPTRWYAYVYGDIDNRLAEKPLEVANMDLQNLRLSREELASGESLVIGTINVPLTSVSPPQAGSFPFKAALISSTYFGTDIKTRVTMNVVAPPPAAAASATDEDLDLDETEVADEESDEEIEGLSDIDTSTEEEDNADEEK